MRDYQFAMTDGLEVGPVSTHEALCTLHDPWESVPMCVGPAVFRRPRFLDVHHLLWLSQSLCYLSCASLLTKSAFLYFYGECYRYSSRNCPEYVDCCR